MFHWHHSDYFVIRRQGEGSGDSLFVTTAAMAWSVASSVTVDSAIATAKPTFIIANMPTNERVTAPIRDELRRVIALYCMDIIFKKDSMKVAAMRTMMFDLFHGNASKDIISHVQLLCTADDVFADLFEERHDNAVNRQNQKDGVPPKQLKTIYARVEQPYILGRHITVDLLSTVSFNSSTLASGRMLLNAAKETLKTIKKACAELKQLVNEDGTPKKSGETVEDVVNQLLDIMFHALKGKKQLVEEDDGTEENSDVEGALQ